MSASTRRTLFVCACLGLLAFGVVLTTLGAVLPSIIERFGIDKAQAGALFLLMTLGILAGSLVFGPMVDTYGYKWIMLVALVCIVVGLEGIAFAPSLGWLRGAIVLIGLGGGIINGATNALVADISSGERGASLNLLGAFFGIGAVGVPFLLGTLTGQFSQSEIIAAVGALVVVPLIFIAVTEFPAPKQPQGFPIAAAGRLLRDPLLLTMGFMLFLESGMEITVGGWTSTFVNEKLGVSPRRALIILSLYWMGMTLARLALGSVLKKAPPVRVLYICLSIAFAGAIVLLVTQRASLAALGVFMLGAGFAATFPNILGFIGDRYADLSGTAFSLAIAMALIGGMLMPYAAGVLGGKYGMRSSMLVVPVALVFLMATLAIVSGRLRSAPGTR